MWKNYNYNKTKNPLLSILTITTVRKEKNNTWKTIAQKIMLSETDYAARVILLQIYHISYWVKLPGYAV